MLGLTFDKLVIIAVIAAFLLGPQRLPAAAAGLGRFVRTLKNLAQDTTGRIREEVGPEFDDIDWARFDPRQYDPRRIIRDALTSDEEPADASGGDATAPPRAEPPPASSSQDGIPAQRGTPPQSE
ncbi:twin-arginine translocase TatA/TatE family subunit [Leifsonia sp. 2MCAF36]|uniref:twin-arginine translocase TatA/TatE family subunit n=1 Tax=Leifsonia sp. 2MCAF36 TaxID=3232988 RepID=UPI003F9BEBAD